jgi:glycosyltransferase involved in cell wall biosynthesis
VKDGIVTSESKPVVSVSIMTRNYGQFISEAIESVLNQSFSDWELLISDDGSEDGTIDLVQPYLLDPRIRYVYHEIPLGQSANWAYTLSQSRAARLATLHADDIWLPGMLMAGMKCFDSNSTIDIYSANWQIIRGEDVEPEPPIREPSRTLTGPQAYKRSLVQNFCLPSATIFSRRVLDLAGPPSADLQLIVDFEFALRLFSVARAVHWNTVPGVLYRHHASSTTSSASSVKLAGDFEKLPAMTEHHGMSAKGLRNRYAVRYVSACGMRSVGVRECLSGRWKLGRGMLYKALAVCPLSILFFKLLIDLGCVRTGHLGRKAFKYFH